MTHQDFKIALFDAKPYDRLFFDAENKKYGFDLTYFEEKLRPQTAPLAAGFDAVCAFVNDDLSEQTIEWFQDEYENILSVLIKEVE